MVLLFKKHPYWPAVCSVLRKLHRAGFKAYLAGGCIRDGLLKRVPKDFDIATSARPEELLNLFPEGRKQGKSFGVIALRLPPLKKEKSSSVEIATFRKDGPYRDGRRPEFVTFCSEKEDALRRDFTINALFYDIKTGDVLDYVGGVRDLTSQLIRTVGTPLQKFEEDKLRLIRAIRFSVVTGFRIEKQTQKTLFDMKESLNTQVAPERVYEESLKTLRTGKFERAFYFFNKLGLFSFLWQLCEDKKTCQVFWRYPPPDGWLDEAEKTWAYALYPLCMGIKKPQLDSFLRNHKNSVWHRRFREKRFPLKTLKFLRQVLFASFCFLDREKTSKGKKLALLNSPGGGEALHLLKTYLKSQGKSLHSLSRLSKTFETLKLKGLLKPLVTGEDLKKYKKIKKQDMASNLQKLYEYQLEHQITNKACLLKQIKDLKARGSRHFPPGLKTPQNRFPGD